MRDILSAPQDVRVKVLAPVEAGQSSCAHGDEGRDPEAPTPSSAPGRCLADARRCSGARCLHRRIPL